MGLAKRDMETVEAQGFYCKADKYVCSDCVGDYALKAHIQQYAVRNQCDYCNRTCSQHIAAHIKQLLQIVVDGIRTEWGEPSDEGVSWDGREGGWQGVSVLNSYELIYCDLNEEMQIDCDELLDDIMDALREKQWCRINPYALREHEENLFTWELFCDQVKHETRYVFFHTNDENNTYGNMYAQPHEILKTIGSAAKALGLIHIAAKGFSFVRGRTHNDSTGFLKVSELASPPRASATYPNRMSPAGIPMFYGGLDHATATDEIRDDNNYVTLGTFINLHDIVLLDLSRDIPVPSLFDEQRRSLRNAAIFFKQFVRNLSKPIEKDKIEHIEYVPTQIVTEYFRRMYATERGQRLQGILYPSSKRKGGVCCVLFVENEHCTQDFKDVSKLLSLDSRSIVTRAL